MKLGMEERTLKGSKKLSALDGSFKKNSQQPGPKVEQRLITSFPVWWKYHFMIGGEVLTQLSHI